MFEPYPLHIQLSPEKLQLRKWDYNNSQVFLITLISPNKELIFGDIVNDGCYSCNCGRCIDISKEISAMELSDVGQVAQNCWDDLPVFLNKTFAETMSILPNHIHGIIAIKDSETSITDIVEYYKKSINNDLSKLNIKSIDWTNNAIITPIVNNDMYLQIKYMIDRNKKKWRLDPLFY